MIFAIVLGVAVAASIILSACGSDEDRADNAASERAAAIATLQRAANDAVGSGLVGVAVDHVTLARTDAVVAGVRRIGKPDAIRPTDFFKIGSTTKAMTAVVAARLVERGTIAWTTTLAEALPELADGMLPAYRTVTLAQLLDHRGGVLAFTDWSDLNAFLDAFAATGRPMPDTPAGRARVVAAWLLAQQPPKGVVPGRDFFYSNAGYALVAMMLEARSGQSFLALYDAELAKPLGMTAAWVRRDARLTDAPIGHGGAKGRVDEVPPLATALAAWTEVIAASGDGLALPPESYATWLRWHLKALRGEPTPLPSSYLQRLRALKPGEYAVGWQGDVFDGRALLSHAGADNGHTSLVVLDQQGRSASFVFTNTEATTDDWVVETLAQGVAGIERALPPK